MLCRDCYEGSMEEGTKLIPILDCEVGVCEQCGMTDNLVIGSASEVICQQEEEVEDYIICPGCNAIMYCPPTYDGIPVPCHRCEGGEE